MKTEPTPIVLVAVTSPPIARARSRLIAKPRPVPPVGTEPGARSCTNGYFAAVITAKAAVATFDTRITVAKLRPLNLSSLKALQAQLK